MKSQAAIQVDTVQVGDWREEKIAESALHSRLVATSKVNIYNHVEYNHKLHEFEK